MSHTTEFYKSPGPIGVFDSGYGGLTILDKIRRELPEYDYIYLGDNARNPYGSRSFEVVYEYTLQCVNALFERGCHLVILACNTASAKALRSIQQRNLKTIDPARRVLGVIRPTAEVIGSYSQSKSVGLFATEGTIQSGSYPIEIEKFFPEVKLYGQACPMWVPLIENNEHDNAGAEYFIKKYIDALLAQSDEIDTVLLGCTHYPLLEDKIKELLPKEISVVTQGEIVAKSLKAYLERHPEIDDTCSKGGEVVYYTTESAAKFKQSASIFLQEEIDPETIHLT